MSKTAVRIQDYSLHCSDSRLRGPSWYAARQKTGFKPYAITSPGTTATPKIIGHIAQRINEEYAENPNTVFRIHVVGHGTLVRAHDVEGAGYANYDTSHNKGDPQCGMGGGGTFLQHILREILTEGRVWFNGGYHEVSNMRELEHILKTYYNLDQPIQKLVRNNPPIHQHVKEQIEILKHELGKLAPNARKLYFAGIEGHNYEFWPIFAGGEDPDVTPEDSPYVGLYGEARKLFEALPEGQRKAEVESRMGGQTPPYCIFIAPGIKGSASRILSDRLGTGIKSGNQFSLIHFPNDNSLLSDIGFAYWADHLLENTEKKGTPVFLSPRNLDPRKMEDDIRNSPIGHWVFTHFGDRFSKPKRIREPESAR